MTDTTNTTGTTGTIGLAPVVHHARDCEPRWFHGGGVHRWRATSADTGGAYLLFEDEMERGKCSPLHTHPADESMYVLEGELRMHLDGVDHDVSDGGLVLAPRGVPHAFLVLSETARVLWLHTPATCEAFYLTASEPLLEDTERVVDLARVQAAAAAVGGIEILGPPPFARS